MEKTQLSDAEWRARLTPEQYAVLREKGTERAFTGAYTDTKTPGVYRCAGCGTELFRSDAKFDSGSGWPSFVEPASLESVDTHVDSSHGMIRTEVTCAACGGHLGHVFPDGPGPGGQRYCINSCALELEPQSGIHSWDSRSRESLKPEPTVLGPPSLEPRRTVGGSGRPEAHPIFT